MHLDFSVGTSDANPMDYLFFVFGCPPDFKEGHSDTVRRVLWNKADNIVSCSDDRYSVSRGSGFARSLPSVVSRRCTVS